jgi:hypothetical protein
MAKGGGERRAFVLHPSAFGFHPTVLVAGTVSIRNLMME